jgi:hypothetical protein
MGDVCSASSRWLQAPCLCVVPTLRPLWSSAVACAPSCAVLRMMWHAKCASLHVHARSGRSWVYWRWLGTSRWSRTCRMHSGAAFGLVCTTRGCFIGVYHQGVFY